MKSIIAIITAVISFFSGYFSDFFDALFFPEAPQTESVEFAKNLGNGWNLGNTLEACEKGSSEKQGLESEIYWGNPYTSKELIEAVRNAGFGGVNRYEKYDLMDGNGLLKSTAIRLDKLTKKTYVQSRSFDEVALLSKRAGDMAQCIPAIPPIVPDKKKYKLSSSFGYRSDPFSGRSTMHKGVDFSLKPGNPIYATGDGVVESVGFEFFGYGNSVLIDHGFGYKTRYAHLKTIGVVEGMPVKRGECIGQSGNTGKSSGPHLHYEVIYKGRPVNPYNYYDLDMTPQEYSTLVQSTADASPKITLHPSHQKKVRTK